MWCMDGVSGFWKRIDIRKENKMGILIKGKGLPHDCGCCFASHFAAYFDERRCGLSCDLYDDSNEPVENTVDTHAHKHTKPDYCPLIYVPDND